MEKLRHVRPPIQSPLGTKSRSHLIHHSAHILLPGLSQMWFCNKTQQPEKGGLHLAQELRSWKRWVYRKSHEINPQFDL